jgi:HSP20 family protein
MALSDLIPGGPTQNSATRISEDTHPFVALHREMNRLFDNFFRGFDWPMPSSSWAVGGWPHVEVSDSEDQVKVVAELPGMEQKDVEVMLHDGMLTLKGEKKAETNGAVYSERWHGQFQRSIQLGPDVDPDKITAEFKNGVLSVTAAKRPEAQRQVKRIPVNG